MLRLARGSLSFSCFPLTQVKDISVSNTTQRSFSHFPGDGSSGGSMAAQEHPSHRQMDGVNILIKHLGRRFLFTSRLLGSDISQSVRSFLSNPFRLPRTPSHKHTAPPSSPLLSLSPSLINSADVGSERGKRSRSRRVDCQTAWSGSERSRLHTSMW